MLALSTLGRGSIPGRFILKTCKMVHAVSCLAFSTSGKSMGVKHTLLPDGQPPPVKFTVLA